MPKGLEMLSNEYLCIGVEHQGKVIIPKHYEVDDGLHYSAGICPGCVTVHKRMVNVDRFAFGAFCNGTQVK
jgi:hypothetical protein